MIRWIANNLGTAPRSDLSIPEGVNILDVRDLVDKFGNSATATRQKIEQGARWLDQGKTVVVCCDYGISRSNAIAAGILSLNRNIKLNQAVQMVIEATDEQEIKLDPIGAVRAALAEVETGRLENHGSTVLVTGGSGFLGQNLLTRLDSNHTCVAPTSNEIDLCAGAILLDLATRKIQADCIVHMANPRVFTSNRAFGEMLTMLRNVIEVCCENDIRLVFPSSWEVYSAYTSTRKLADETLERRARGPLGEAKLFCENLIDIHRRQSGLKCALIRSATVYGNTMERPRFINTFVKKARLEHEIFTHQYANGPARLDLLHVRDYTDAIEEVIKGGFSGDLNLGSGESVSTREVAQWIVELTGSGSEISTRFIEDNAPDIVMDSSKAGQCLSWQPKIDWKTGIKGLFEVTDS